MDRTRKDALFSFSSLRPISEVKVKYLAWLKSPALASQSRRTGASPASMGLFLLNETSGADERQKRGGNGVKMKIIADVRCSCVVREREEGAVRLPRCNKSRPSRPPNPTFGWYPFHLTLCARRAEERACVRAVMQPGTAQCLFSSQNTEGGTPPALWQTSHTPRPEDVISHT